MLFVGLLNFSGVVTVNSALFLNLRRWVILFIYFFGSMIITFFPIRFHFLCLLSVILVCLHGVSF